MTGIAAGGGFVGFVAVDAPFHLYGLLDLYGFLLRYVAVAGFAFDPGSGMLTVAEEHKFGRLVDAA